MTGYSRSAIGHSEGSFRPSQTTRKITKPVVVYNCVTKKIYKMNSAPVVAPSAALIAYNNYLKEQRFIPYYCMGHVRKIAIAEEMFPNVLNRPILNCKFIAVVQTLTGSVSYYDVDRVFTTKVGLWFSSPLTDEVLGFDPEAATPFTVGQTPVHSIVLLRDLQFDRVVSGFDPYNTVFHNDLYIEELLKLVKEDKNNGIVRDCVMNPTITPLLFVGSVDRLKSAFGEAVAARPVVEVTAPLVAAPEKVDKEEAAAPLTPATPTPPPPVEVEVEVAVVTATAPPPQPAAPAAPTTPESAPAQKPPAAVLSQLPQALSKKHHPNGEHSSVGSDGSIASNKRPATTPDNGGAATPAPVETIKRQNVKGVASAAPPPPIPIQKPKKSFFDVGEEWKN